MKVPNRPYHIHFVCRGNTYRSRLAAAYFATFADKRFILSSSGVGVRDADVHTIQKYTRAIARRHKLTYGLDGASTQTTKAILDRANVVIFMNKDVYEDALREYQVDSRKSLVWHVSDISPRHRTEILAQGGEIAMADAVESTLKAIQMECDELYAYLTRTEWVDIVTPENTPTDLRLPLVWANDRALYHRGIHVVVRTHDGKFVVGKRESNIVFAPGMLEITLGGGVDTSETPLQAAQRETFEELGIHVPQAAFKPLFISKSNHYHPRYKRHNATHVYFYSVVLPMHSERLRPQPGEVAEVRLLSRWQVGHLLRTTRLAHFGRLGFGQKLCQKAVAYALTTV